MDQFNSAIFPYHADPLPHTYSIDYSGSVDRWAWDYITPQTKARTIPGSPYRGIFPANNRWLRRLNRVQHPLTELITSVHDARSPLKVEMHIPDSDSSSNSEDLPAPPKHHHSPLEANAARFFRAKACVNLGKNKGGGNGEVKGRSKANVSQRIHPDTCCFQFWRGEFRFRFCWNWWVFWNDEKQDKGSQRFQTENRETAAERERRTLLWMQDK